MPTADLVHIPADGVRVEGSLHLPATPRWPG